jgi:acetylornithine deacetylase/succinyl-diaminopimelate desuccinylase-like protein
MNQEQCREIVEQTWDRSIIPSLVEYIKIPNKSPAFDPDWSEHGFMDQAVDHIAAWCREQVIEGLQVEIVRLEGRTPVICMEIPGQSDDTVLLYGHLDKQPEMEGWDDDLGPWKPVLRDEKLYGRGGADDGYAAYASLTAIRALQEQKIPFARCVVLIEACEESGSFDLPYYIDHLEDRIGRPSLVVCLDSGCGNYDQLWSTTNLRGMITGNLTIEVLSEGVHSGDASGIVPSSFRILRQLLSRVEDDKTGEVLGGAFQAPIPDQRVAQAELAADMLGELTWKQYPFLDGMSPVVADRTQQVLNRTWRPALAVTGVSGMPSLENAGNVLRPLTAVKLSLRVPPTTDVDAATAALKKILETDPPYGAHVHFKADLGGPGWEAPPLAPWLEQAQMKASKAFFDAPAVLMGEGGSIPFMGMLGEKFPAAQFLITGLLGPGSNAHGPNEFLHIPCGKKLTCCVASVLADHHGREG